MLVVIVDNTASDLYCARVSAIFVPKEINSRLDELAIGDPQRTGHGRPLFW